jgi:hypothetical protein
MGLTQKLGTIPLAVFTDSSNNVGIGAAASGSFKLQVTGTTNLTGALTGTSATFSGNSTIVDINTTTRALRVTGKNNFFATEIIGNSTTGQSFGQTISAGTNSSDIAFQIYNQAESAIRLMVRGDGNVGIGTDNPDFGSFGAGERILGISNSSARARISLQNTSTGTTGVAGTIAFWNGSTQLAQYEVLADGATNKGRHVFLTNDGSGSTEKMRITSGGTLQVGTRGDASESTANLYLANVNYGAYHFLDGTAYYIGQNSNFRALRMYSGGNNAVGVNLAAGGTSWGTYSDERLKENIVNIDSVLPALSTLRTVKYHLKNVDTEDSQKRYGLIAQDLVGKFDEVLNLSKYSDEDTTEYYDVRYTELIPVLVKAIQELKLEIEELKQK